MKNIITAIAFSFVLLFSLPTFAAELLMIHAPYCGYCVAFLKEVAPGFNETFRGKALPLRVLDVSKSENIDWLKEQIRVKNIKGISGTPTFIIMHEGKERGRVVGYAGKEWFYPVLDQAVKKSVQPK